MKDVPPFMLPAMAAPQGAFALPDNPGLAYPF
jgi:hypothetical protein